MNVCVSVGRTAHPFLTECTDDSCSAVEVCYEGTLHAMDMEDATGRPVTYILLGLCVSQLNDAVMAIICNSIHTHTHMHALMHTCTAHC